MSLTLSNTLQNNISDDNIPLLQPWGIFPPPIVYNYNSNLLTLTPQLTINFRIRDIIGLTQFSNYESFELLARQYYQPSNTIEWLNPSCYIGHGYPNTLNVSEVYYNGLSFEFRPLFQNLPLLPTGTYTFNHEFIIRGLDASGSWNVIDTHTFQTILNVQSVGVIVFPLWINFFHQQGNTLPQKEISVNGNNWELRSQPNFVLSSTDPGVIITSESISGQTFYKAQGNGTAIVNCTLGEYYDTETSYESQDLTSFIDVYAENNYQSSIQISVDVVETPILSVNVTQLDFYAVKEVFEPNPIDIIVLSTHPPYSISKSPWLQVFDATAEIEGVIRPVKRVIPIPTSNMEVGQYDGFVKFSDTVDGDFIEIDIPVTYNLEGFVQSPYQQSRHAFTLDSVFFRFLTQYPNSYFQIEALIKTYSFFDSIEKITTIFEKVPVFQGKGELNFGQIIHRLMSKFTAPNENYLQYKPALLSLSVKEINLINNEVVRETFIQEKPFLAGLSKGMNYNYGFLNFNKKADRVTVNSFFYLNLFVPDNGYELKLFKNGTQVQTIPILNPSGYIVSKKIFFNEFRQGDIIEYKLEPSSLIEIPNSPSKMFYVIPESYFSNHIIWEDEFLLQSAFEFTGALKIQAEFENRTQNTYKNFAEVMEIITNTKVNKLSISTGWIIKDSIDTIESLLRSKKAWLVNSNNEIALRPITKSVIAEDTERELVEFLIEFQINRSYNEETYFF